MTLTSKGGSGIYVEVGSADATINVGDNTDITGGRYGVYLANPTNTQSSKSGSETLNVNGGKITGTDAGVYATCANSPKKNTSVNVNITAGELSSIKVDTKSALKNNEPVKVTISGGTIEGDLHSFGADKITVSGGTVKGNVTSNGTMTISGGKFAGNLSNGKNGTIAISGGSFSSEIKPEYCAAGFVPAQNADGTYGVTSAKVYYAAIGETKYDTLADAIAAAKDGDTITLLANCEAERVNLEDKSLKVVLNGYTLTSTSAYGVMFCAKNGNTITIDGTVEGSKLVGTLMVTNGTDGHIAISGGTYENSKYCPIYINGAVITDNSTLTVKGATIIANGTDSDQDAGCAVYLAGYCTSSFTDTTITAPVTGIEIRAGKLTLKNCTVAGGSGEVTTSANGNGTTVTNAALAISQHNTKKPIDVTITSGEYTATAALFQTDVQGTGSVGVNATVASGTFNGTVSAETNNTVAVKGGKFTSEVPENCCADGFVPTQNEDGTYGVKSGAYVAEVKGKKYETLQAAIDAAPRNATVTLLANTRENVTIDKAMTLDLNGFTLNGGTEKGKPALTITARTVTIKDSSEAQTGTIMREDTAENSGVSSHYVIDIQGNAWVMFESGNVKNNSGNTEGKGASLVRVGDDSVAKQPGLVINGGTFTQDNFIVIKVDRGYLKLNGGTLNSANSYAVENWFSAEIKGGTVNGDVASWTYSGGSNSTLTIEGGTVNGNVTSVNYGNADKVAKVEITGGTVTGKLDTRSYDPTTGELTSITDAAKSTIKITGGTFSSDPTKYVIEDSAITANADGTFGVTKAYLAKVGDTSYYTMEEAFKAQTTSGEPVVLLRDYTTGGTFNSGSINRTVDLNGHTWTYTGTNVNDAAFEINYPDVTLTVKNGTVVSGSMVGLIPSAMGGTKTYDNSGLVLDGVTATANGNSGIETNGNNTNDRVTLKNSTLNVPNGFGIYFPSSGTLTIDNSTINAKTMGVQVCAGNLSINAGSAITVSGGPVEKTENDGAIQDGAAISVVNRTGYKGLGTVTVSSGKFTAKEGNSAIKAYDWANKTESDFTANKGTINVSGGTFTSAVPENCCAAGYIPQDNGNGIYGVKEGTYVAEYNGTKYESLLAAIDAASHRNGGQTEVTLLCNVTIKETVTFAKEFSAGSVLLNLGGYTLTGEGCRALQINRGNLYLENGTVTSTGIVDSSSVIRIGSNEATYNGATPMLYMQKDAKVVAPESYGVTIFGSATRGEKLKVMSNAEIIATGPSPAISGNGGANYNTDDRTSGWKAEEIIIGENAVISAANNYAIYHPECGTLNIQGGTITGTGGIQMCSGTLKISNSPKITANGSADYDYTGDAGVVYDAAAISVINRGYPQGPATVTIKGTPTVTAANGEVIHAFTWSNSNKTDGEWAEAGDYINVSGGTYNKQFNEAFLTADSSLVANTEGGYTVDLKKVAELNDGTQYTSLAQAILKANAQGGTVKLLEDVTLTNSLGIGGSVAVTLNLNKKTLTLDGAQIYTQGSATVTINNGTIKRIDAPTSGSASNFAIQVMSGSSLTLGAGIGSTYKVVLESTYGIYNVGGTLTVRYATITTEGWSIAVSDSASKTGVVYVGRGMGGNTKTVITSTSGNVIGTMVSSKSDVTIDYGTLTSNGTEWDAGVVYWASEGTLTIEGGTFTASSAEGSTAAAVYQKNGTVKISGAATKLLGNNALVVQTGEGSTGTMVTELSGGKYSTKPDEAWVVEGKEIHETDGLYVVEGPYVVEVTLEDGTTTKFDSWLNAFTSNYAQYNNATVKLLNDIETSTVVKTFATVTIDFNGHTLTVSASGVAAITVLTKGTAGNVTLKDSVGGGGMVTTGVYGVTVKGTGATATVESGTYNCTTTAVQVENGTAYIKGGTFQTEDESKIYLLNCIDDAFKAGTAKIEVTGGTFYGFDPSASPEGEGTTYVANGYVSTKNENEDSYTVEEYKPVEVRASYNGASLGSYATIEEAVNNRGDNKWIAIVGDYTLTADYVIPEGVGIDVQSGATLTIPAGVTLTVPANAKRLGVSEVGTVDGEGKVLIEGRGNAFNESKVMINGTMSTDMLDVPNGFIIAKNSNSYYAAEAVFEITYSDGTVKKAGSLTNLTNATKATLLKDATNFAGTIGKGVAENFVLDLGGYTLSGKATATTNVLKIDAPMTIQHGTIKYASSNTGSGALMTSADVTIASDAIIDGGAGYAIWTDGYGHTLTVNGTVTSNGSYAITGNGSENGGLIADCSITVNDGAVISAPNGIAIYHPELGTVTVNGGTISGHTGIELCAGKLVVSDGSITSTGDNMDATGSQNAILDGAAISIINRNYPGGTPTAEISGGTFKATGNGAQTIKAYDYTGNTVAEWTNVSDSVKVSGGTFSSAVEPDYCAEGYVPVANEDGTTYGVRLGGDVTIVASSNPSGAGQLKGGGNYKPGTNVELVAEPTIGYTFKGWYLGNDLVSSDATFTIRVPSDGTTTEVKYEARFTATTNQTLDVSVGYGTVESTFANGDTMTWSNDHSSAYPKGTKFTLKAVHGDDVEFLYWLNVTNGRVLTTNPEYTFYLGDNMNLKACYRRAAKKTYHVIFLDKNGRELEKKDVNKDGTTTVPAHLTFAGYVFTGWLEDDGVTVIDAGATEVQVTKDMIFTAQYKVVDTKYKVAIVGGETTEHSYGDKVTVTATAVEGKEFIGWYIANSDTRVSYDLEYTFFVTADVTLEARYNGTKPEKQPIYNMTMGERTAASNGFQTIVMTLSWEMPEGYEFVEAGFVVTRDGAQQNNLKIENVSKNVIVKLSTTAQSSSGTYVYTWKIAETKSAYACGYVTYVKDGVAVTVYTAVSSSVVD